VPLGQTRLQIARLIAMMIMSGQDCVIIELAKLGTLSVLLVIEFCFAVYLNSLNLYHWSVYFSLDPVNTVLKQLCAGPL